MCSKKRKRTPLEVKTQKQLNALMLNNDTDTDPDDTLSEQIQTLVDRRDNLDAGYAYILGNENAVHFDHLTARQAETQVSDASGRVNGQIQVLQALQTKRRNFANRLINKQAKGGYTGDGNCYISFVNVGMGDCTLIATPLGKTIMIDCGSDSLSDVILDPDFDPSTKLTAEDFVRNTIKDTKFLNGGVDIDLLFLTHPDGDHHDKLEPFLTPLNVSIGMVYFGGADQITNFTSSAYIQQVAGTTKGTLRKVHLCEQAVRVKNKIVVTKTINDAELPEEGTPNGLGDEFVDPDTGAIVVYYEKGTKSKQSDFKISILASNVTGVWKGERFIQSDKEIKGAGEMKGEGTWPNTRCLMILIECFGKSALVCGDATALTENFAVDYFADLLEKVDYLRIGHHGSPTSSAQRFVDSLKAMKYAVASTGGKNTVKNNLPKQRIIAMYPTQVSKGAAAHDIYAFKKADTISRIYFSKLTRNVYATGSNDTIPFTIVNTKGL